MGWVASERKLEEARARAQVQGGQQCPGPICRPSVAADAPHAVHASTALRHSHTKKRPKTRSNLYRSAGVSLSLAIPLCNSFDPFLDSVLAASMGPCVGARVTSRDHLRMTHGA